MTPDTKHTPTPQPAKFWGEPTADDSIECIASAEHWERLAQDELDRLRWDKHYLPAIASARAEVYQQCARRLRERAAAALRLAEGGQP